MIQTIDKSEKTTAGSEYLKPPDPVDLLVANSRVYASLSDYWVLGHGVVEKDSPEASAFRADVLKYRTNKFRLEHPDEFNKLVAVGVDCFHGTTTYNLHSILNSGIMPSSRLDGLGITAIGKEAYSQPKKRSGVHVVPLCFAGETFKYAENRMNPNSGEFVNTHNYQNFLHNSHLAVNPPPNPGSIHQHIIGTYEEAYLLDRSIQAGTYDGIEGYPVVIGINSSLIDPNAVIEPVSSAIDGDVTVKTTIPTQAIKIIYTSASGLGYVKEIIEVSSISSCEVRDLNDIRQSRHYTL